MKKKGIMIISIIIVIVGLLLFLNYRSINQQAVVAKESLIELQAKKEKDFNIGNATFNNPKVILNPYGNAPLSALVMFKTKDDNAVKVTIKGKDKLTTFNNTFEKTKEHYLPIYGLYANTNNTVIIESNNKRKVLKIKTAKLDKKVVIPTKVKANKAKLNNDLYFYSPATANYTAAYDVNGDVRWYLTNNALWKIDYLKNGHLLISSERLINPPYYSTGLYEMDLLGKIYNEYSLEGGYHHDYYELENGNLLIASNDFNNEAGTVEDVIVEMDRKSGEIIKKYDLKNIMKMDDGKSENWTDYDWFHNNSVWYDKKTNSITLSGRHQDAVINIDYDDGKLNWIIGDNTNWSKEYQKYFFKPKTKDFEWQWSQHAAMITPEGYVFILDNGNNKSKIKKDYVAAEQSYTRGVMYKIDSDKMNIKQVWQYGKERGSSFYSPYISDVDYLSKKHYIVHSGGIVYKNGKVQNQPAGLSGSDKLVSDTVELLNDEVIFELVLPTNNYRVEKMSLYNSNQGLHKQTAQRKGSLGKTKVDGNKYGPFINTKTIDQKYQNHEIKITKEIDRLVVDGRFKKDEDIKVILYKNMKANLYDVRVSKKPYTALCVDILNEDEDKNGIVVTKNINEDGLSGKYSIYLEIDGVVYNTKEFVEF